MSENENHSVRGGSRPLERGFAEAAGARIAYQVEGEGPPLICCHAMGWDHTLWDPHRATLAKTHRLITFDHRGCGDSDHPTAPDLYSAEGFAEDLEAVLDALGIERARVMGYSMGAVAAMRFAIDQPERVERLVLVSAMASRLPEAVIERARVVADMVHSAGLAETYRFYFDGPLFDGAPKGAEFDRDVAACLAKATPHGFLGCFSVAIDRPSLLEELHRITAPTLIIAGQKDVHYVADADRMAARISEAKVEIVKNAGHALTAEQPAAFEEAVMSFLDAP